jgi:hypothetical protein
MNHLILVSLYKGLQARKKVIAKLILLQLQTLEKKGNKEILWQMKVEVLLCSKWWTVKKEEIMQAMLWKTSLSQISVLTLNLPEKLRKMVATELSNSNSLMLRI